MAEVRAGGSRWRQVDLAGSERLKKSESEGQRLKEMKSINTSLSVLGKVVLALAQREPETRVAHLSLRLSHTPRHSTEPSAVSGDTRGAPEPSASVRDTRGAPGSFSGSVRDTRSTWSLQRGVRDRGLQADAILKDSLAGNSYTALLATLYAKPENYEESLSTLQFAHRCTAVATVPHVNYVSTDALAQVPPPPVPAS
ncbi:hypothetical protein CYMTET_34723 [Cymbomonas tetramitiformis]|uniref:Kinesin motor domain-containing protein n=1 Tax=Cymbomonas tetramitiformis TaxID=36881 RepID=A0AAE0FAR1_9CHLO|nr:hypothetical protein CYMTET_34723 [Cymbomonas tetramitiformis]